ncbi:MAG: hypothetical protein HFG78_12830 [Hungatella sp.]|nr:hypothetical protein [Hungatella sp.]MCI9503154.1 hypothetical protein [Hungatella sp.]
MVAYARSTYKKAKKFQENLKELQKTIPPAVMRMYLAAKNGQVDSRAALGLNLSPDQKAELDELNALRMSGIQAETKYAIAQADKNGIQLSEDIISGRSIAPGFDRELMDKAPSLGVYHLFMLFTEEEFH